MLIRHLLKLSVDKFDYNISVIKHIKFTEVNVEKTIRTPQLSYK